MGLIVFAISNVNKTAQQIITNNGYFVHYEVGLFKMLLHFPYYKGNGKGAQKLH